MSVFRQARRLRTLPTACAFLLILVSCAFAEADANSRAEILKAKLARALVKIKVEGDAKVGASKREGTGFFIRWGPWQGVLITAQHVVGSGDPSVNNPDWQVDNAGHIQRKISFLFMTESETLSQNEVTFRQLTTVNPGTDIAVLLVSAKNHPAIDVMESDLAVQLQSLRDVTLLGFPFGQSTFRVPQPMGQGQLELLNEFNTLPVFKIQTAASMPGESGGAWIDIAAGRVVAVASKTRNAPNGQFSEATPLYLVFSTLERELPRGKPEEAEARLEEIEYQDAGENLDKLRDYRDSCKYCRFKPAAVLNIKRLEQDKQRAADTERWGLIYAAAHGDLKSLKRYVEQCGQYCEFRDAALKEIAAIEQNNDKRERDQQRAMQEEITFREARGSIVKLRGYLDGCKVCKFRDAALAEIKSIDDKERLAQLVQRDTADYEAARGNKEKLRSYIASCSEAGCRYRAVAEAEIISLAAQECDRAMASQFDTDVPASVPFVADLSRLRDPDLDAAMSSCDAARQPPDSHRRFLTQAGRAYAARAGRRARKAAPDVAGARADLDAAVALWKAAEAKRSGAAMNFLGVYERGGFDVSPILVAPSGDNKADANQAALKYWLKGAAAGNARAMRNAGSMLLAGQSEYPGIEEDVSKARDLLQRAVDRGEPTAAAELGRAYFSGWRVPKDEARGLELLVKSCAAGDKYAGEFFDKEMSKPVRNPALPAERPQGCESDRAAPTSIRMGGTTYWDYNDSVLSLDVKGAAWKFSYYTPRDGLAKVGVTQGTLYFEGERNGNTLTGRAYIFSRFCGPLAYPVKGTISSDKRVVDLSGKTPQRNKDCNVVRYLDEPIRLTVRQETAMK